MKDKIYRAEVVIRYNPRGIPPTSLFGLRLELEKVCNGFTPKIPVRQERATDE